MSYGDRQSVIDLAVSRWGPELAASRPGLNLRSWVDEQLDAGGHPRLRAEERQAIAPEQPRYRSDESERRSFFR